MTIHLQCSNLGCSSEAVYQLKGFITPRDQPGTPAILLSCAADLSELCGRFVTTVVTHVLGREAA